MKSENNEEKMQKMRHSAAHVLAAAVVKLYPTVKLGIGPAIENAFYYDFDFGDQKITDTDLEKISGSIVQIIELKVPFNREELSTDEAKKIFHNQPYKLELIADLEKGGHKTVSIYHTGEFLDLCEGSHVENTSQIGPVKLLSLAGAYWRGSEKNKMLTRIYGTCFETKEELDKYLKQLEEAKKRDHRKIGKELDLFSFHPEAPGFVFWHPKGMMLREIIMNLHNKLHRKADYQIVSTPILLSADLWRKSGHWNNYKDKMYFTKIENRTFAIKPMNCPGACLIFREHIRSYRDLPLRLAEQGEVHRHEPSGTLHGLFRVRAFRQDDAHIFVREDQIGEEVKKIITLTLEFYKIFGFKDIAVELSTRPEKHIGSKNTWNKAESILEKILRALSLTYKINAGEGSFYGPKIDFHIKDSLSRSWQCGTIQLDFFMPTRLDVTYIDRDGLPKHPIMIHRTVIGSIQRFTGVLIENYGGAFPLWLAPVQVAIIPIADRHQKYAREVLMKLKNEGIRIELDDRSETMQAKIRDATLQKVPYMVIIGDREEKAQTVSVRTRDGKDLGPAELTKFIDKIKLEIEDKS